MTNASFLGLSTSAELSPLHRVLIYRTCVLPQLCQFCANIQGKLANEGPYKVSISGIKLRLAELQESNNKAHKIRAKGLKNKDEEVDRILHHQKLPFIPKTIQIELISWYHDDFLAGHFGIDKTKELVSRKYYWLSLQRDIQAYVKGCNVCLASKAVRHKPYGDFKTLSIPTH